MDDVWFAGKYKKPFREVNLGKIIMLNLRRIGDGYDFCIFVHKKQSYGHSNY